MAYDNNRNQGQSFSKRDDKPKELHDAVCAQCKKNCQVPFKPTGTKPVTCRECFAASKTSDSGRSSRDSGRPSFERRPAPVADHTKQFKELNSRLDKIVVQLAALEEHLNPKPEKTRNAPDNTVDHQALKDVIGSTGA